jgi:hypothetical protein
MLHASSASTGTDCVVVIADRPSHTLKQIDESPPLDSLPPASQQMNLVTPKIVGADAVKSTAASSVKRLYDPEIALAGGVGVVTAHELVVQAL